MTVALRRRVERAEWELWVHGFLTAFPADLRPTAAAATRRISEGDKLAFAAAVFTVVPDDQLWDALAQLDEFLPLEWKAGAAEVAALSDEELSARLGWGGPEEALLAECAVLDEDAFE